MPELPEVETVRRAIQTYGLHRLITSVDVRCEKLRTPIDRDFADQCAGGRIMDVDRRGKYMLISLDHGGDGTNGGKQVYGFVVHLGMSGMVRLADQGQDLQKHDHVVFDLDNGDRLIFHDPRRFGQIIGVTGADFKSLPLFTKMGPEPLSDAFSLDYFIAALSKRSGPIKTVLLDQAVVAGLGNIYVCEALHLAGISPLRRACDLSHDNAARLIPHIQEVLRRAIDAGGSSLKDYRHPDGKPGYFQYDFAVYGREDAPCQRCAAHHKAKKAGDKALTSLVDPAVIGHIKRIRQAGRSTFYCPNCQI